VHDRVSEPKRSAALCFAKSTSDTESQRRYSFSQSVIWLIQMRLKNQYASRPPDNPHCTNRLRYVWCGQGVRSLWLPRTQVWPHRGGGNVARCSAPAASVWTKRGCRERSWGQAGDNSHVFQCVSEICAASCPQLVPTHPPFAHTAPRYPRCGLMTPAALQQLVL
jgi:hypothetical protein